MKAVIKHVWAAWLTLLMVGSLVLIDRQDDRIRALENSHNTQALQRSIAPPPSDACPQEYGACYIESDRFQHEWERGSLWELECSPTGMPPYTPCGYRYITSNEGDPK